MPKPEWGTKRLCESCGARFYDFSRTPIICPACETEFDLATIVKPRRAVTVKAEDAANPEAKKVAAATAETEDDQEEAETDDEAEEVDDELDGETLETGDGDTIDGDDDNVVDDGISDDEEEDSALVEDASELGDDDDMSDVIDTSVDDENEQN